MTAMLVVIACGLGAVARLLVDRALARSRVWGLPVGTVVINASGSLLAGIAAGLVLADSSWLALPAAALLGSYSTFSTAMVEVVRVGQQRPLAALLHGVGSMAIALGAAIGGVALAGVWT